MENDKVQHNDNVEPVDEISSEDLERVNGGMNILPEYINSKAAPKK